MKPYIFQANNLSEITPYFLKHDFILPFQYPAIAIPYFVKGLEELYEQKRFIELVRLGELEVIFRISSIIQSFNPNLPNKEYVIYANNYPADFLIHYRKVMRLESIEKGNAYTIKNISERLLKETKNLTIIS
jgi:hypothetical protein